VPAYNLRNGRLNQTAYALYLFIRDIAGCDLVAWIDAQLRKEAEDSHVYHVKAPTVVGNPPHFYCGCAGDSGSARQSRMQLVFGHFVPIPR
jgi:hypothetical protein